VRGNYCVWKVRERNLAFLPSPTFIPQDIQFSIKIYHLQSIRPGVVFNVTGAIMFKEIQA
jgi:hypothetical protein